ncbi:hypothetical protein HS99_0034250 [Kitasatospora aureofaciens]|uniref:Uncharacterized protein n=1 Tax=Kitasatospora aureofaciens TaxID=1894 RepID=A0A1E7N360_KITAU|nr:hypothetical protein HS99_0034250 [Kitasatospora aureofaciens]
MLRSGRDGLLLVRSPTAVAVRAARAARAGAPPPTNCANAAASSPTWPPRSRRTTPRCCAPSEPS